MKDSISTADICYLLQGTLDTPRKALADNLTSLKAIAEELSRADLLEFLSWVQESSKGFLAGVAGSRKE